jgi:hypothetical protein
MFDNFLGSFLDGIGSSILDTSSTNFVEYLKSRCLNSETLALLSSEQQHEIVESFKSWRAAR